jgi:hypothetical protein
MILIKLGCKGQDLDPRCAGWGELRLRFRMQSER